MDFLIFALVIGSGATALMDLWTMLRMRLFDIALPNYRFVGRWLAHMPRGRFRHDSIAAAPVVTAEHLLGWAAHYLIGIAFAALLLGVWGVTWAQRPTLGPALAVGIGTVVMPFLLMQPGMGAGIAGSRTPNPFSTRLHSLANHVVFGLGLYAAAWFARWLLER
jgi:polyferredoxin